MLDQSPSFLLSPDIFQHLVLDWFHQNGRKNLPWQQNKNPYKVWLSEIMLQQTQVNTVISYYRRFLEKFPTVVSLASAAEDEVLHLWSGLGYYNRARNLHKTAKIITDKFQGKFPRSLAALESLPGIGRSTAGAILSIAFDEPTPILDGNVKRLLTRLHGIQEWPGQKKILDKLWLLATQFTPKKQAAHYAQAVMDLGATLCIRGQPSCSKCPFTPYCVSHLLGIEKTLPKSKVNKKLPTREVTLLIFKKDQSVLLEKRPTKGIWASLWSLPELEGRPSSEAIRLHCLEKYDHSFQNIQIHERFRHTLSHFHLDISPVIIFCKKNKSKTMADKNEIWYNPRDPVKIGLPAPVKKLLSEKL